MSHDQELSDLLSFDAIDVAEKIHENSGYKSDFDSIALLLHMASTQRVNAALEARDDTKLSNDLTRYIRIIEELGFEKVLDTPFMGKGWGDEPEVEEHQMVYAHRDGMLLVFDTYNGEGVNSAKVYYAHKLNEGTSRSGVYSSGGFETISGEWPEYGSKIIPTDMYWFGDHDAREALRHNIQGLRNAGQFLNPWPAPKRGSRWLWMCHYMDLNDLSHGDPEYQQRIADARKRLDLLPDWVKTMINIETLTA